MFEKILLPLDGSAVAEEVVDHALALARVLGAEIQLLHVVEADDEEAAIDPFSWAIRRSHAQSYLRSVQARLLEAGAESDLLITAGNTARRILQAAVPGTLMLLSSSGAGSATRADTPAFLGTVAHKVVARTHTSVMVVPAGRGSRAHRDYRRVLVPLDGSRRAECVLPLARRLAGHGGVELLLAHVVNRPEGVHGDGGSLAAELAERNRCAAAPYLQQVQKQVQSSLPARARVHLAEGSPLPILQELAAGADLVLLAAHGYGGRRGMPFGHVTTGFLARPSVPTLVVQDLQPDEIGLSPAESALRVGRGIPRTAVVPGA